MSEVIELKEYIPIKQGLRHVPIHLMHFPAITQRVYSNKTRIKTRERLRKRKGQIPSKSIFQ